MISNEALHQILEEPWALTYMAMLRPVVVQELVETNLTFSKHLPGFVKNNWKHIDGLSLIDPFRMGVLVDRVIEVEGIRGDIVECGSFKGGSGIMMAQLLKELGIEKHIHLFDSFAGLPDPHEELDKGYKKGQFVSDYDRLAATVESLSLGDKITIHRGWFKDTVPKFVEAQANGLAVALLHIDCDLYTSTTDCFPALYPWVRDGGVVILDDYNDGGRGEMKAILEFTAGEEIEFEVGPAPQVYFKKGTGRSGSTGTVEEGENSYSFAELLDNGAYLDWLKKDSGQDFRAKIEAFLSLA